MKEPSKGSNVTNTVTTVLFIIYLLALYWILLLKLGVQFSYMASRRTNFVPFSQSAVLTGENLLNVLIFIPLGLYTGVLFKKWNFSKKLLFCFFVSVLVEGIQFILRIGAFDVTDFITNTLGGLVGLVLFNGLEKAFQDGGKAQRFINVIAATGTALMLLLLVLLKMNMLPVRYQ
jgi:glycopeptide antibiotics resistance protein